LKRVLDEAERCVLRHNWWRMMMMIFLILRRTERHMIKNVCCWYLFDRA
jgi:hypothetical protein